MKIIFCAAITVIQNIPEQQCAGTMHKALVASDDGIEEDDQACKNLT